LTLEKDFDPLFFIPNGLKQDLFAICAIHQTNPPKFLLRINPQIILLSALIFMNENISNQKLKNVFSRLVYPKLIQCKQDFSEKKIHHHQKENLQLKLWN
jgi:hypothetical protein